MVIAAGYAFEYLFKIIVAWMADKDRLCANISAPQGVPSCL
jgi:hypothetical protein